MNFLYPLVALAVLGLTVACPFDRRGRGRHVSRRLARLAHLDPLGVMAAQTAGMIVEAGWAVFIGPTSVALLVMMAVTVVWLGDDLLTGGPDDRRKRKHEWARVKIRMPQPVKLRPIERTPAPVPA